MSLLGALGGIGAGLQQAYQMQQQGQRNKLINDYITQNNALGAINLSNAQDKQKAYAAGEAAYNGEPDPNEEDDGGGNGSDTSTTASAPDQTTPAPAMPAPQTAAQIMFAAPPGGVAGGLGLALGANSPNLSGAATQAMDSSSPSFPGLTNAFAPSGTQSTAFSAAPSPTGTPLSAVPPSSQPAAAQPAASPSPAPTTAAPTAQSSEDGGENDAEEEEENPPAPAAAPSASAGAPASQAAGASAPSASTALIKMPGDDYERAAKAAEPYDLGVAEEFRRRGAAANQAVAQNYQNMSQIAEAKFNNSILPQLQDLRSQELAGKITSTQANLKIQQMGISKQLGDAQNQFLAGVFGMYATGNRQAAITTYNNGQLVQPGTTVSDFVVKPASGTTPATIYGVDSAGKAVYDKNGNPVSMPLNTAKSLLAQQGTTYQKLSPGEGIYAINQKQGTSSVLASAPDKPIQVAADSRLVNANTGQTVVPATGGSKADTDYAAKLNTQYLGDGYQVTDNKQNQASDTTSMMMQLTHSGMDRASAYAQAYKEVAKGYDKNGNKLAPAPGTAGAPSGTNWMRPAQGNLQ